MVPLFFVPCDPWAQIVQSGECVLLEQPVEDVAVSNVLVVAEPDGIQGELCDVEETSICEIPVEQRIVICCRLQCISVFRERQRQHLELDISSGEMDDFAFFAELSILLDDFAGNAESSSEMGDFTEWVSDMDVRLGKSEVMLRSFDGIHECVWPLTCLIHFSQLIGRNTHHSSKTRALI